MKKTITPISYLIKIIPKYFKWIFLNGFIFWIASFSMVFATKVFWQIIDEMIRNPQIIPYKSLIFFTIALICYELLYRIWHIIELYIITSKIRKIIKKSLLDHTLSLQYWYFVDRFAWWIAHRISTITNSYESLILVFTNWFIDNIILMIAISYILINIHFSLAIILVVWIVIFLVWIIPIARKLNKNSEIYAMEENKTTSLFGDIYTNIQTVKVYGNKKEQSKELYNQIENEYTLFKKLWFYWILLYSYQWISWIILSLSLIWWAYYLFLNWLLSIWDFTLLMWIVIKIFLGIWWMWPNIASWNKNYWEITQNLWDILVTPSFSDSVNPKYLSDKKNLSITFKNVDFSYIEWKQVLNNFSLDIKAWEKVWIVWSSWAGKSTLVNLLLRFYDINNWKILVDDIDIRDLLQDELRSKITYVSQDTILFHKSILENIRYSKSDASNKEVKEASVIAHCDEFINELQNWYDTIVWDRWLKLSGWQRQRIAIARAILKNPQIFLLDEATSALDSESEKKVQDAIFKLMDWKTVIAIAHRLSTLLSMDRIVVMKDWKVLEEWAHEELLQKKWIYHKLWDMQAWWFIPELDEVEI